MRELLIRRRDPSAGWGGGWSRGSLLTGPSIRATMPSIKPWAAAGQSGQGKGLPSASPRSNSAQVYISIVRIMMLRSASTSAGNAGRARPPHHRHHRAPNGGRHDRRTKSRSALDGIPPHATPQLPTCLSMSATEHSHARPMKQGSVLTGVTSGSTALATVVSTCCQPRGTRSPGTLQCSARTVSRSVLPAVFRRSLRTLA